MMAAMETAHVARRADPAKAPSRVQCGALRSWQDSYRLCADRPL